MKRNNGFLDIALVVAALIMFTKTADVLSYFSPGNLNAVIGMDVSAIYGGVCALLVEGVALALHFNKQAESYTPAQWVKWTLIVISGICQVFDGYIVTNALATQTDTMKLVFQYGVPLIPLLLVVMIFIIGNIPDAGEKKEWRGIKNMLPLAMRDPLSFWHGAGYKPTQKPANTPQVMSYPANTPEIKLANNEDKPKQNPQ